MEREHRCSLWREFLSPMLSLSGIALVGLVGCGPGDIQSDADAGDGGALDVQDAGTDKRDDVEDATPDASATSLTSLLGTTFDLSLPPNPDANQWCLGRCGPAVLLVGPSDETRAKLLWGRSGHATWIGITRGPKGWTLDDPFLLGSEDEEWDMCLDRTEVRTATFAFHRDTDGNPRVTIQAHEFTERCSDDTSSSTSSDVEIEGGPDDRLSALASKRVVEPLAKVWLPMDKPLEPAASARLTPAAGPALNLAPVAMADVVVGFETNHVLPLGSLWTLSFEGVDVGSVGTPTDVPIQVVKDFGVLAPDGFETGSMDGVYWHPHEYQSPSVVTDYAEGEVGPIAGTRMLQIPAGLRTVLRVKRLPEHTGVSMDVRAVNECGSVLDFGALDVTWAVVGTSERQVHHVVPTEVQPLPHGYAGRDAGVSEVQRLWLPLTGSGEDVLIAIEGDGYKGSGCSSVLALVDEVVAAAAP